MNFTTFDDARAYAAAEGVKITATDYAQIGRLQAAELKRIKALEAEADGTVSRIVNTFNRLYPQFLEAIIGAGDVAMSFTQTIAVSVGVPLTLLFLLIVEQTRVMHGILLFEQNHALANFAACSVVILNIVLEFSIHYIEHRAGFQEPDIQKWSLRTVLAGITTAVGLSQDTRPTSPAHQARTLLRLVTFTILTLALAGSMHSTISQMDGVWHTALIAIITQSSLAEMTTWLGGLLFAVTAVLGAQGLARYVAVKCVEITAHRKSTDDQERYTEALDAVAVNYISAKVSDARQRRISSNGKRDENPFLASEFVG